MKVYVLMTSLALMAGTAVGYFNGKGAAQSQFAEACVDTKLAALYDRGNDELRHFHCFELKTDASDAPAAGSKPAQLQLVL
jgi:hypothetical protein